MVTRRTDPYNCSPPTRDDPGQWRSSYHSESCVATALACERASAIWYAAMTDLHLPQTASFAQFTLKKVAIYGDDVERYCGECVEEGWGQVMTSPYLSAPVS
jgi:hypothetical protein